MAQQWPYKGFKGHYAAILRRLLGGVLDAKTLREVALCKAKLSVLDDEVNTLGASQLRAKSAGSAATPKAGWLAAGAAQQQQQQLHPEAS